MYKKLVFVICFILTLILTGISTTNAELVGWWRLNEMSGTTVFDSSGSGNDGTFVGEPVWVDGVTGSALEMDGDDYVEVPGAADINPESVTLMAWVNFNDVDTASMERQDYVSRADDYALSLHELDADGKIHGIISSAGEWSVVGGETLVETNIWYHTALTYDADTDMLIIYLDGEVDGELEVTTGLEHRLGGPLTIGIYLDRGLLGKIDDVQIWDEALSIEGIQDAMAGGAVTTAFGSEPSDGEVDVSRDIVLSWKKGDYAVTHDIYFGTDINDVNEATRDNTRDVLVMPDYTDTSYDPPGLLDYDTIYYWRVDEVNEAEPNSPWKGNIWSFTTRNFVVVEDFEDYNDLPPNEIFMSWEDGYFDPTNGSTSGYPAPDFIGGEHYLEGDFVHGGLFSFPLLYDNSVGLSEVTKTLNADWTIDDVITLTLFYYGDASNDIVPMYVAIDGDAIVTHDDPKAALDSEWNRWDILLQDFADMGVDLTNVKSISIGFGDKINPTAGGEGMVLFDDIRLYRTPPIEFVPGPEPVEPGMTNVEVYYDFENDTRDNSGNNRHATALNGPVYVSGSTGFGTALSLDGLNDYVSLPIGPVISTLTDCTIATWVNWSGQGNAWQRIFDFGTGETVYMFLTGNASGGSLRFAITISGNTNEDLTTSPGGLPSRWHHVAVTIDSSNNTHTLYLDGKVVAQNTTARYTPRDLGVTTQNWLGKAQFSVDPYFRGSLDEFYIFDRVLSQNEILYLAGK
jgi:hypothetical protein